jgi:hypothetical protein
VNPSKGVGEEGKTAGEDEEEEDAGRRKEEEEEEGARRTVCQQIGKSR